MQATTFTAAKTAKMSDFSKSAYKISKSSRVSKAQKRRQLASEESKKSDVFKICLIISVKVGFCERGKSCIQGKRKIYVPLCPNDPHHDSLNPTHNPLPQREAPLPIAPLP